MSIPEAVREECECDSLYLLDFLALHLLSESPSLRGPVDLEHGEIRPRRCLGQWLHL